MTKKLRCFTFLALLPAILLLGCGDMGQVDQGRVVAFDKDKWTVNIIRDKGEPGAPGEPGKPDYSVLPPVTFTLPKNPSEMGPEPKVGMRMNLDTAKKVITIFDPSTQGFKKIDYTLIDQKENVEKTDPLVANKTFPVIDKAKKAITVYSGRQKILTTFTLPEEYFALPDNSWDAGDEVRIYYKEPGQARRFMNITKTDIFRK
jgi:hypothetical protein